MAYIGKTPSQAVRSRYFYTAAGGETSLSGADDNGDTLIFADGNYVDVYLNGVLLVASSDYNVNTVNTIAGLTALTASDIVEIVVYDTFSVFGGTFQGNLSSSTITTNSINLGSTTTVSSVLDEDTMTSDSATALATQQSIKAYVDTQVATVPVGDITEVTAGTGLTGGGTSGAVTLNIDSTVATLTGTQTLTNKTLGATSVTGDVTFGDNNKAIFGAGSDLEIYHDGSNSFISDQGTGNLRILAQNFKVINSTNSENMIEADVDGKVKLYFDNVEKLETNATGVDVTGTVTADGLTVDTDTLYVDSANNRVGIGTSSPNAKVEIVNTSAGAVATQLFLHNASDADGTGARLDFAGLSTGTIPTGSISNIRTAAGAYALTFNTYGGGANSERLRIDSSGNLLVGTTTASGNKFKVERTDSDNAIAEFKTNNANGDVIIRSSGGYGRVRATGTNELAFLNAGTEAMRIDTSGNLLVGKTSAGLSNVGFQALSSGVVGITRSGSNPLDLNRLSSDGTLIEFNKDGTTVGSIGTEGTWGSGPQFLGSNSRGFIIANPTTSVNEIIPNVDTIGKLGNSSNRWQDLYLSGGVYLGGTGSDNLLDDYEEGTWTPNIGGSGATYGNQQGLYTKVGRYVCAVFDITVNARNSGTTNELHGFPFTANNGVSPAMGVYSGNVSFYSGVSQNLYSMDMYIINGTTKAYFTGHTTASGNINNAFSVWQNGTRILGTVHYFAE